MKLINYLLVSCLIFIISCQRIKGSYCTIPNTTVVCIEFKNRKELIYHTAIDYGYLGMDYGVYRTKKDTIIIEFEEIPEKYKLISNERYDIIKFESSTKDSVQIEMKCKGSWIANIYCREDHSNRIFYGETTNLEGEVSFNISQDRLPFKLEVSYEKSGVIIPIKENGEYGIEVILNEQKGRTSYNSMRGAREEYIIKGDKKNLYIVKIGDEKNGRFYKYRKKKL